jgi:ribonuclease BN (tRNA processing enzyme)
MRITIFILIVLFFSPVSPVVNAACDSSRVSLQMLGTRGPELFDENASTGYLLWLDDKATVIVDAGPGTVQRFKQSGARFEDVELILFTHFHVDHSADFPTYIKGSYFTDRNTNLHIIGPSGNALLPSADAFVERMFNAVNGVYPYLNEYIDHDAQSDYKIVPHTIPWSEKNLEIRTVYETADYDVKAVSVHHGPLPALGYRIETAGCVISFTGDMNGSLGRMPALARDSDILVAHNAVPEDATGVATNLHMKPSYIGAMAAEAGVKQLVLSHLMRRTINRKDETLRIIRQKYKGTVIFPDDLDVIRP